MSTTCQELASYINDLLKIYEFDDYGPNGLQIEGANKIDKVALAVSATKESIDQAIEKGVQALIVHHGLFWKFHGPKTITGPFAKRVIPLIKNEINLLAYHLPLDGHATLGNAASIAQRLGLSDLTPFGTHKKSTIGIQGNFKNPILPGNLKKNLETILNHNVIAASANKNTPIKNIGIITGGANAEWTTSVTENLDAYLTGEISEHDWHESQEAGIHMFAGGHYATEQFGIQSLMENIQQKLAVECLYISSQNPA